MHKVNFFNNIKIQKKIFSSLLFIFIIPVLSIGIFFVVRSKDEMIERYKEHVAAENMRTKSILFDLTTNFYNISQNFVTDSSLIELLSSKYTNNTDVRKHFDQYKEIKKVLSQQTSILDLKIYTNNSTIDYDHIVFCDTTIKNTDWYKALSNDKSIIWTSSPHTQNGHTLYYLTMYRLIPLPLSKDFAILELSSSNNYLTNRMSNTFIPSMINVNQEPCFYDNITNSDSSKMLGPIDYSCFIYQDSGLFNIQNSTGIGAISTLRPYRSEDYIYLFSFSSKAYTYVRQMYFINLSIISFALLLPSILLYFYTRNFSVRIYQLRSAMRKASRGDYNIIHSFAGDDELSETFHDLIIMIENIKRQDALMYQSKIKEQELINHQQLLENRQQQIEYKILTNQINPHFLYNTLESIRMKAFNENNLEVATAIKMLGRYLHYSLESVGSTSTTLEKELYYIELYLGIQKMRFKERINYNIEIDENFDISTYTTLPFILQPIVENAVHHGLEGIEKKGHILIKIYPFQNKYLFIDVEDNGDGMDSETLKNLQENIMIKNIERTQSIGLYNINQRILLCYGNEYGIFIDSIKGIGTKITLHLPLSINTKEVSYVKNINS